MATKYRPQTQKSLAWEDLEKYYVDLNTHNRGMERLLELVRHIKNTGLSVRLFGGIAMLDKLIVGIYDPIEWNREALHVEFDKQNRHWCFQYYSLPNKKPELERKYREDLGIEKFDQFILMVKW